MIEILRFELAPGTDEEAFLRADKAFQEGFAYQQPGLLRRTTARGDQHWVVISLWRSAEEAQASAARAEHDPVARALLDLLDPASTQTEHYHELS